MLTFHQCGHNFVWNIDSYSEDEAGDGFIISPVNIESVRIRDRYTDEHLQASFFDPQFYLPEDDKSNLSTYPFFPANVIDEFSTTEYEDVALSVATECLRFQLSLDLKYLVIPTRYFDDLPENYLVQLSSIFTEPFINAFNELESSKPLLLTAITKPIHFENGIHRDELLTWLTSFHELDGVYLIFDNNFYSKQIKDPGFLAGALRFINVLRMNDLEVHVGYSGLEGILYSVADPTSVSMGSYENLRSFNKSRLETREPRNQRPPNPRIFSLRLLQWIEEIYLPPMRELIPNWEDLFNDSPYKEYLLDDDSALNFQKSEIYKHYFLLFSDYIDELPDVSSRGDHIRATVNNAMELFDKIREAGVVLDSDSDGSHLPTWLNALAMFEEHPV